MDEHGSPPRTPTPTTVKSKIQYLKEEIKGKERMLKNIPERIRQSLQSQKYGNSAYETEYLRKREVELPSEIISSKRKYENIANPKTHTKRMRPLFSRSRSLSLGRSNSNKKTVNLRRSRSNSLGGKRKRRTRSRK